MATATVSAKGWVVIPAPYRHRHHLTPGTKVEIVDYGDSIGIVPSMANPPRDARGTLRGGRSLTAALLAERSKERRCEDALQVHS
ncbi:MAG: AbrB/MazE/SpoVT family DNA-binding domain-containing protein [Lentisphaeria bacterium]|nr:AbrB/MazE/SpoVT family DNA-binding domain-containing protein [Lentisphaeria bacterium]